MRFLFGRVSLAVDHTRQDEEEIGEAIQIDEDVFVDRFLGRQPHDAPFGATGDGARQMQQSTRHGAPG